MKGLGLFALSGLLFALMFPNLAFDRGLGAIAFVFLLPALMALRRATLAGAALGGAVFALVGYGLMNWWLYNYDPLAPIAAALFSAACYAALFLAMSFAIRSLPRTGWIMAPALWVGAEYLKTRGFFGYPFGLVGYSQYRFVALAQCASLAGVWLVSVLVLAPQFLAASAADSSREGDEASGGCAKRTLRSLLRALPAIAAILIAVSWGEYRLARGLESAPSSSLKIALVQPNIAPHEESPEAYDGELSTLMLATSPALAQRPDLVVWPETAFVPSIAWHERYRTDEEIWPIVERCLAFIHSSGADFIIGNNQGELEVGADGKARRVDYNAVLAFRRDRPGFSVYRKIHLVPFSEYFPFERSMPRVYRFLAQREGSFWKPGSRVGALQTSRFRVATPICFEDAFGDLTRRLAADGASLIVPVVNDVWSKSTAAEYEHAACSVFRAVETGLSVARCTNSGLTCVISPLGRIEASLDTFSSGVLVRELRIRPAVSTLYARIGDVLAQACLLAGLASLLAAAMRRGVKAFCRRLARRA